MRTEANYSRTRPSESTIETSDSRKRTIDWGKKPGDSTTEATGSKTGPPDS